MQSLIPFALAVSLVSAGTPFNLVPYAYLSSPVPYYQQYQNTRTGEHAFSYAGGPSAKEEIKDADGVLRGSYSYIDANGILQSVFYVADDNGFRVAATNLPTDSNDNAEPVHVILARNADTEKLTKNRRRRSLADGPQGSSPSEEKLSRSSSLSPAKEGSNVERDEELATGKALYQPLLLAGDIPLATSHQSQVQVHGNARLDLTVPEAKPVDLPAVLPAQTILGSLPLLARAPTYHENRIELHKNLGIEGARPKDAVKIDAEPVTLVQETALPVASAILAKQTVPLVPLIAKEAVPVVPAAQIGTASVTASVSSHGISQIHGYPKQGPLVASGLIAKESLPVGEESKGSIPLVPLLKENLGTVSASISSHGISQIHGASQLRLEPTYLYRTVPFAQLYPIQYQLFG